MHSVRTPARSLVALALVACGGAAVEAPGSPPAETAPASPAHPGGAPTEAPPATTSSAPPATSAPADGAPARVACTTALGPGLTTTHGRLDGYVRALVAPKDTSCPTDPTHLHVQVEAGKATFDVAINLDGLEGETSRADLPGGAWSEGWHAGTALDYPDDLGVHASAITNTGLSELRARVEGLLASANHVAVYATGYGPDGAHLVHREGGGRDGALVLDPLGATPRFVVFRFAKDSF